MKKLNCLRCDTAMNYIGTESLQQGRAGWVLGDLPHLFSGALEVEIYACSKCGKIEFFSATELEPESTLPQKKCPKCGKEHDFDFPKCPYCNHSYFE